MPSIPTCPHLLLRCLSCAQRWLSPREGWGHCPLSRCCSLLPGGQELKLPSSVTCYNCSQSSFFPQSIYQMFIIYRHCSGTQNFIILVRYQSKWWHSTWKARPYAVHTAAHSKNKFRNECQDEKHWLKLKKPMQLWLSSSYLFNVSSISLKWNLRAYMEIIGFNPVSSLPL